MLLGLQAFIRDLSDGFVAINEEVNCSMALTVFAQNVLY